MQEQFYPGVHGGIVGAGYNPGIIYNGMNPTGGMDTAYQGGINQGMHVEGGISYNAGEMEYERGMNPRFGFEGGSTVQYAGENACGIQYGGGYNGGIHYGGGNEGGIQFERENGGGVHYVNSGNYGGIQHEGGNAGGILYGRGYNEGIPYGERNDGGMLYGGDNNGGIQYGAGIETGIPYGGEEIGEGIPRQMNEGIPRQMNEDAAATGGIIGGMEYGQGIPRGIEEERRMEEPQVLLENESGIPRGLASMNGIPNGMESAIGKEHGTGIQSGTGSDPEPMEGWMASLEESLRQERSQQEAMKYGHGIPGRTEEGRECHGTKELRQKPLVGRKPVKSNVFKPPLKKQ